MLRRFVLCAALLAVLGMALISTPSVAGQGDTERVSVSSSGEQGNSDSRAPSISADGRYVAFDSYAPNLVPNDTNSSRDIFVYDQVTNETQRVSISSSGEQGNRDSMFPSISADGRYIAFTSMASNLAPDSARRGVQVFVHDRVTGETARVSISSSGEQGDLLSYAPSISADGRFVAFSSDARNLVPGDTNRLIDIFVHDRVTGVTKRVSVSSSGEQGTGRSGSRSSTPAMSADGRFVAFESGAPNLVPGDTNGHTDVFVHDQLTKETARVSVSSSGQQTSGYSFSPSISADGRYVAFESDSSYLDDVNSANGIFVHDRLTGQTECVSNCHTGKSSYWGDSFSPSISADGRYVVFASYASKLVPGDTNSAFDTFVHDRATGAIVRVSVSSSGEQADYGSYESSISADGRYVAFESGASNLVPGDTNGCDDVFVHQYLPDTVEVSAPDGWLNPGWNYFSIPLDPAGWPEASDVLGFNCKNTLYRWNPARRSCELYPYDFECLVRGRGYLLRLNTDIAPSYEGLAHVGDFEIALPERGWTWIGQPFDFDTELATVLVRNNTTGQVRTAWEDNQALDAWVRWDLLYWWSARDAWRICGLETADDHSLRPWHGYLVWSYARDLTLIVPAGTPEPPPPPR